MTATIEEMAARWHKAKAEQTSRADARATAKRALLPTAKQLHWHQSLPETMTMEVPGIRPAIVSEQALPALREFLASRHFFRHADSVPLDPARLASLSTRAAAVQPTLQKTSSDGIGGLRN